jgi:hypothetical protein
VTVARLPGDDRAMDDDELEDFLAAYAAACAEAGVEPLPDDEARESARWMLALLRPAFEREFRLH